MSGDAMNAIEYLIHIAEDCGDEKLGGIAWGRMATAARRELSALVACREALEAVVKVLNEPFVMPILSRPNGVTTIRSVLKQARTALARAAKEGT